MLWDSCQLMDGLLWYSLDSSCYSLTDSMVHYGSLMFTKFLNQLPMGSWGTASTSCHNSDNSKCCAKGTTEFQHLAWFSSSPFLGSHGSSMIIFCKLKKCEGFGKKHIWLGGLTGDDFWRMYTPSRSRKHELSRPTWSITGKAIMHDVFLKHWLKPSNMHRIWVPTNFKSHIINHTLHHFLVKKSRIILVGVTQFLSSIPSNHLTWTLSKRVGRLVSTRKNSYFQSQRANQI